MLDSDEEKAFEEVAGILKPLLTSADLPCLAHPDRAAVAVCRKCASGLCVECFGKARPDLMLCGRCSAGAHAANAFVTSLKLLKLPGTWVLLCILVAGFFYALGVGNPSMEAMARQDARTKWFYARPGKIYLKQASRQKQRAAALRHFGDVSAARHWSYMAARAFGHSAEHWRETPAWPHLQYASADMYAEAGRYDRAAAVLAETDGTGGEELPPWFFYLAGLIHRDNGDTERGDLYLRTAMARSSGSGDVFDRLFEDWAGRNRHESEMLIRISKIAGTDFTPEEVGRLSARALGVESSAAVDEGFGFPLPAVVPQVPFSVPNSCPLPPRGGGGDGRKEDDFEVEFIR